MQLVELTIKNYRCFTDALPARLTIGRGFTALVGANNSGKSSVLRFFIEHQPLWNALRNPATFGQMVDGSRPIPTDVMWVEDQTEIFCDENERPLVLELKWARGGNSASLDSRVLSRCAFTRDRSGVWRATASAISATGEEVRCVGDAGGALTDTSPRQRVDVSPLRQFVEMVHDAMYIPPFRNAVTESTGPYYALSIGSAFVGTWQAWLTGGSKVHNRTLLRVEEDIARIFGYSKLSITATADQKSLHLAVDGKPYKLREQGAGLSQFIVVMGNVATRRPSILLIDEPELNLHPSLQVDFLTTLASYTTDGTLLYATHNVGLARTVGERVYSFRRSPEGVIVSPFENLSGRYAEFAGEMAFSAYREMGFSTILLVEGPSEVKAVQQILRMLRRDHQVVMIQLGGSSMIRSGVQQELNELRRLSDHVVALIDSERLKAGDALDSSRQSFVEECAEVGIKVHATERRSFENYFTDSAVRTIFGNSYRAPNGFEALEDLPNGWRKADNWRVVGAMTWDEWKNTDVGQFLESSTASVAR